MSKSFYEKHEIRDWLQETKDWDVIHESDIQELTKRLNVLTRK